MTVESYLQVLIADQLEVGLHALGGERVPAEGERVVAGAAHVQRDHVGQVARRQPRARHAQDQRAAYVLLSLHTCDTEEDGVLGVLNEADRDITTYRYLTTLVRCWTCIFFLF